MKNRAGAVLSLLVWALIVTTRANGQVPTWVGMKVVTKYKTPLRIGNQVVDDRNEFQVYTVEKVKDDWLWLSSRSVSGWVRSSGVVAFDQALDFYTEEIRVKPGSSYAYVWRGILWAWRGEPDNALADYSEAIRLDPKDASLDSHGGETG